MQLSILVCMHYSSCTPWRQGILELELSIAGILWVSSNNDHNISKYHKNCDYRICDFRSGRISNYLNFLKSLWVQDQYSGNSKMPRGEPFQEVKCLWTEQNLGVNHNIIDNVNLLTRSYCTWDRVETLDTQNKGQPGGLGEQYCQCQHCDNPAHSPGFHLELGGGGS